MIVFGGIVPTTFNPGEYGVQQRDTTEIHEIGSNKWVKVNPLPKGNSRMASVAINNVVYSIGKYW